MTDADFAFLRAFLRERSGLDLGPEKRYLAESRLGPVLQDSGLPSLSALIADLRRTGDSRLAQRIVEAMMTHETSFFRDRTPFEALRADILPRLLARRAGERRLRLWSAAASTGQEAYSLAMLLHDLRPKLDGWRTDILATDISVAAIARGRAGVYSQFEVQRGLPIRRLLAHFAQAGEAWTIEPDLRSMVQFRVLNLLADLRPLGTFDVIFCRNVLIYLDGPTRLRLLRKLERALAPDGVLCLGTSEGVIGLTAGFEPHPARGDAFLRPPVQASPVALTA